MSECDNCLVVKGFEIAYKQKSDDLKKIHELHRAIDLCDCNWEPFCDDCFDRWQEIKAICEGVEE